MAKAPVVIDQALTEIGIVLSVELLDQPTHAPIPGPEDLLPQIRSSFPGLPLLARAQRFRVVSSGTFSQ